MVEQMNLASCEYPNEVDEFKKSGFTPIDSDLVKPKRVKESPFQMECKLLQLISIGDGGMSGNLAICEIVKFHVSEDIFVDGKIDPQLLDLVARNGAEYYTRASGAAIFTIQKPGSKKGIGFDGLPNYIKNSKILTANNLAKLALQESMPSNEDAIEFINTIEVIDFSWGKFEIFIKSNDYRKALGASLGINNLNNFQSLDYIEIAIKCALDNGDVDFAWKATIFFGIKSG